MPASTLDPSEVAKHCAAANKDESGEYRANKYNRTLGAEPRPGLPPLPILPAALPLDELVAHLREHGGAVLKGAIPLDRVDAARDEHQRLLSAVTPLFIDMQADDPDDAQKGFGVDDGDPDDDASFYKNERALEDPTVCATPLRLRSQTHGRFEMKSLDQRDRGPHLTEHYPELSGLLEPLTVPPVVYDLLQRLMGTPWRVMRVGSLPVQPGAAAGDWHRDIGTGLFGEDADLALPDYYFNALIPLDPVTAQNGTEIVLGSHTMPTEGLGGCDRAVAVADLGDVIFFNGKCVHRGCPNFTDTWRSLIYVVFAAQWFDQGRDPSLEELMPYSVERPTGTDIARRAML